MIRARTAGLLILVFSGVLCADELAELEGEFRKALAADPATYAQVRSNIIGRGEGAAAFLAKRRDEGATWYERVIADAMYLALVSPQQYRGYEREFQGWSDRGSPQWFMSTGHYPWRETHLVKEGEKTVPFLIERMFFEEQHRVRDGTVVGWHMSQPKETALALLRWIGGKDAARAAALSLLSGDGSSEAVCRLSFLSDSQLVDEMIPLLQHRSKLARAAWVLGELRDPRAIEPLIESLVEYDGSVYSFPSHALAKMGEPAIGPLIRALSSDRRETRSWSASALARIGKPALPSLIQTFRGGPEIAHYHAVSALRRIGDREGVPVLVEALGHQSKEIRRIAAQALGEIGDPVAKAPLLRALEDPENWNQIALSGIAEALAVFGEPRAFETLSKLAVHEDWLVRRAAIEALPPTGGERALPILLDLLRHEHKSTRGGAAIALGKLKHTRAVPHLVEALSDPEGFVRSWAAWALGEIGDPAAFETLSKLAVHGDSRIRRAAIRGLPATGRERALPILLDLLRHENKKTRVDAAVALGKLEDPRAVPQLLEALSDRDKSVRSWAAWALGEIGDPEALPALRAYAAAEDRWDIRQAGKEAIEKIMGQTSSEGEEAP